MSDVLAQLAEEVRSDPSSLGLILHGSRATGDHRADSDYDLIRVVTDEAYEERKTARTLLERRDSPNGSKADVAVDANGNLHLPDDYLTTYQFLGSWAVAADQDKGSKELHDVYASPGTIAAYRAGERFPDGTVLVKEVFEAATGEMTTGTVTDFIRIQRAILRPAAEIRRIWQ